MRRLIIPLAAFVAILHADAGLLCAEDGGPTSPSTASSAQLLAGLTSTDPVVLASNVEAMKASIHQSPHKGFQTFALRMLPAMMKSHNYDSADDICAYGIATAPWELKYVRDSLAARARIAIQKHQIERAMKFARSLFNVTRMQDTNLALTLMVECLQAANPDHPEVVEQFKQEQAVGAAIPSDIDQPLMLPSMVKTLFPADEDTYLPLINHVPHDSRAQLSRGNLYLLASRGEKAQREFEKMGSPSKIHPDIAEGISRAYKTEDGLVGRANAYVLSIVQAEGHGSP